MTNIAFSIVDTIIGGASSVFAMKHAKFLLVAAALAAAVPGPAFAKKTGHRPQMSPYTARALAHPPAPARQFTPTVPYINGYPADNPAFDPRNVGHWG